MAAHVATTLAALCGLGGAMGFIRRRSTMSLVAGGSLAGLFAYSSYLIQNNYDHGMQLAAGTSALMALALGMRARASLSRGRSPRMPLVLSVLGVCGTVYYGNKCLQEVSGV